MCFCHSSHSYITYASHTRILLLQTAAVAYTLVTSQPYCYFLLGTAYCPAPCEACAPYHTEMKL